GPYVSSSASAIWQDKITEAPPNDGIIGALTLEGSTSLTWIHSVDFSTILSCGLCSTVDVCTRFSGLDSLALGPQLTLKHKLGLGPYAPSLSLGLEGNAVGFSDSERSRIEGAVVAAYSQRFGDSLQLVVDARGGSYDARDVVFCGNYVSMSGTINWDIDDTWRLRLVGGWRSGDVVSNYTSYDTAQGWVPYDFGAFNNPGAWHEVKTFGTPFVAWRVDARTGFYGFGVSPAIGPHTSLSLQVVTYNTKGYDRYVDNVVTASFVHRF
ncbi:MAG TPA: hypothetical protein VII43_05310, partial [Opitutaceae bacterium]